jgi:CRP-like cAMP-binding protein
VARVRATTDVRGFAISRDDFDKLLGSDSRLALALLRALARRLVETDRLLTSDR